VSIDPIYAYFNVDEASVIRFQKAIEAGQFVGPRQATLPIWLQLDTEIGYPHQGVIDFVDNSFDPSTSTLRLRGRFPNQQGYYLIPGAFGTVRMAGSPKYEGILVAESRDRVGPRPEICDDRPTGWTHEISESGVRTDC